MKIKRVRVENFRCLYKVDISFEEITSFIGPTGVGKSTVLRALDWFFNGEKSVSLSSEDVHSAADGERISVEVEFDGLTAFDRETLGRYAPDGAETVSIWRTWDTGEDKITGKGLAYAPFEEVRRQEGALAKRRAYNALRDGDPSLGLPSVSNEKALVAAMAEWERSHRHLLTESEVEDTHLFGFAGQSVLAKLIDFVFISADLRAYEETDDRKASAIGRILDHAVDRTQAHEQLGEIEQRAQQQRLDVHATVYGPVLTDLSTALSQEVARFTTGREIVVTPVVHTPRPVKTSFQVSIRDGAAETSVHRQGHGFQRALIIAALKLLAERRRPESGSRTLCLAVEEPELFQHPPQARTFAEVLRDLVTSAPEGRTQVMYATHSPVFIDPRNYHEIRRLSRDGTEEHPVTRVRQITERELIGSLPHDLVNEGAIRRKAGIQCAGTLAEAFFARAVVLVEGDTDGAVLTGCAERRRYSLGARGISVISAGGKDNIALCRAILDALEIPTHVVFDGDAGNVERNRRRLEAITDPESRRAKEQTYEGQRRKDMALNAGLLSYLGASPASFPTTATCATHTVFEDNLEAYLGEHWAAWGARRRELVASGDGFPEKNAATYREAARTADAEPPYVIEAMLENIMTLVR
ncbi:ATP-dependent nuclease [Streptomyces sp. NPDC003090]|uniref:ATP-dependent nuclease n=1 Tax=Streptomyces sp. NPDC003090 TaxID=3154274 RepID=UPI0037F9DC66